MPPKIEKVTKKRAVNWTQEDTELLAGLIQDHGEKGILSKETNAATNKMKDGEWKKIEDEFNASDTVNNYLYSFSIYFKKYFLY